MGKNDGGPAFPCPNWDASERKHGMSLRDWFAGMALQGLLSNGSAQKQADSYLSVAEEALVYADAMIAEREPCVVCDKLDEIEDRRTAREKELEALLNEAVGVLGLMDMLRSNQLAKHLINRIRVALTPQDREVA